MIQNYRLLKDSATKFENIRKEGGTSSPQIQKIYSTAHFIVMTLRFQGVTKFLYLGRGGQFQGIYWFSKLPAPKYRIQKDRLLELFRKYFRSERLNELEVIDTDRLFVMKCGNKFAYSNLYWFIKGSQAYASVEYQLKGKAPSYYHLWETKIQSRDNAPEDFLVEFEGLGLNRKENKYQEKVGKGWSEEEYFDFLEKESEFSEVTSKEKKKHLRKIENIKSDIIKLEKGLGLETLLSNETFEIEAGHKIRIYGVKFIFATGDTFYQKRDVIFQKLKRIKWALKMQYERLRELEENKSADRDPDLITKVIQPVWFRRSGDQEQKEKAIQNEQANHYSLYAIREGLLLAVGKNAKGNDFLRNKWGHKNDLWFHVEGHTGSHIIAKGDVLPDDFTLIGSILRDYSKLTIMDVPIIYARLNKVKGLKGRAGAVTIKNPKHIQVIYRPDWRLEL